MTSRVRVKVKVVVVGGGVRVRWPKKPGKILKVTG